ncbi:hypothetical protein [Paenibacillus methanolicus]|uniref:Uncharacterized protein n=1 Tax=Paenibacillus methanolicus TaxID=582686 RepID=A0A5S5CHT1_9BACL|nr:hypothetical protein [Paenibacillus methanolicus]TYP79282.1 hypothetical protein BCM02_101400 [Paenibacillus methanolicus]
MQSYEARGARFVLQLASGRWDSATADFSAGLAASLPGPTLEAFWSQIQAVDGGIASLEHAAIQRNAVHTTAKLLSNG